MVAKKRKSKRQTLQQKFKIVKRVKEHKKKLKRGKLTNGNIVKKQKRSENRIPNAWPHKEDLLREIQAAKERMEEVKLRQKEKRAEEIARRRGLLPPLADANDGAAEDDKMEEEDVEESDKEDTTIGQNSRRAYLRTLRKVAEKADVILHVLDARDPLGTRSHAIEEMVASTAGKRLVFILNKADLVPKDILQQWVAYFRQYHPTILFKSNTQQQKEHLSRESLRVTKSDDDTLAETSHAIGAEEIIQLLKNYARHGASASSSSHSIISVGVVGFPNVGKSSFINSLIRRRVTSVSSTPGHTKALQEVILDKHIRLIDSPGVVFSSIHEGDGEQSADIGGNLLRNCISIDEIDNYIPVIEAILGRVSAPYLMQLYNIPRFNEDDAASFLAQVARAQGKLKKGGVPLLDVAARQVLHDWNTGKIRYHTVPPALPAAAAGSEKQETQLLTSLSSGIDWDKWQSQTQTEAGATAAAAMETEGDEHWEDVAAEEGEEEEEERQETPAQSKQTKKKKAASSSLTGGKKKVSFDSSVGSSKLKKKAFRSKTGSEMEE